MASSAYRSRKSKTSPLWQCLFRHFDAILGQYKECYRKRYSCLRPITSPLSPTLHTARDEARHVLTLRLTQMLMNQNLMFSLFSFYSPSDNDAYFRPIITYKITDH